MNQSSNSVYIIAEAGVNHNGSLDMAKKLIDVAVFAGADAVKFQTFKSEKIISQFAPKADYQIETTGTNKSQLEMVKQLELDTASHQILFDYCQQQGIKFLSTPFDEESLDFLVNTLNVSCLKIPSGEITNALLLLAAGRSHKPVILSTGMSTLSEIEIALGVLAFGYSHSQEKPSELAFKRAYYASEGQNYLQNQVKLLHCITEYPTPYKEVNLKAMDTLKSAFALRVGFSDHTLGINMAVAAVARGAVIIEKHFTLDRNLPGPDHRASLQPEELKMMIDGIRQVELGLGNGQKIPTLSEQKNQIPARKSLVAAKEIIKGEIFTLDNLTVKRPGNGISPMRYWEYLGKTADKNYQIDELIIDE